MGKGSGVLSDGGGDASDSVSIMYLQVLIIQILFYKVVELWVDSSGKVLPIVIYPGKIVCFKYASGCIHAS